MVDKKLSFDDIKDNVLNVEGEQPLDSSADISSLDSPLKKVYERRIVAFTDILGFRNIVQRSSKFFTAAHQIVPEAKEDDLDLRILNALQIEVDSYKEAFAKEFSDDCHEIQETDLRVTTFSDSVILSVPDDPKNFALLLFSISFMVRELLRNGFLCRGGVAYGEVYHSKPDKSSSATIDRVFGPAFIKAYDLESKHANHARIIACNMMWAKIQEWKSNPENCAFCDYISQNIIRESDGAVKIDVLTHYKNKVDEGSYSEVESELKQIKERMESVLSSYVESPRVFSKLSKFAKEFNGVVKDFDESDVVINSSYLP
jgi:hypothetical protein